jgi:hypothetical protein
MYFKRSGKTNTEETIKCAYKRAKELGIKEIVVASSSGATAKTTQRLCKGMKVICVSYHAGVEAPFKLSIPVNTRRHLEKAGVKIVCATHALSGVERGLSQKFPGPYPLLLAAEVLRMFGHGTKVAVEVAIMAADSGNLSGRRIISIGGSSKGADTALVLTPACQSNFFDIKIHEVICKPGLY